MDKKNYLIIDIIPLTKLPPKTPDFFSYYSLKEIPEGSLVLVDFKNRKIPGYAFKVEPIYKKRWFLKKEKLNLKPVLEIINPNPLIFKNQVALGMWLKNYANLSLSYGFTLIFPYLKILKFKKDEFLLNHSQKEKKQILIIVPDETYFEKVFQEIKNKFSKEPFIISSKLSLKKFKLLLDKIFLADEEIFLSVKTGIFLPWQNLKELWVYDEGSFFYKEFFKPPFFDYRKIFLKFCEINKVKYNPLGNFPSLYSIINLNIKPKIEIPFQKIKSLEEFENTLKNFKKTVIFVSQKSMGKVMCQNCFSFLECENCHTFLVLDEALHCPYCLKKYYLPEFCPFCHQKADWTLKRYGAEAIYKYLLKIDRKPVFYEKENKKVTQLFNQKEEIDLVGSLLTLDPRLENIQAFFYFNFDEFYYSYNLFFRERAVRILDFFSKKTKNIFLFSQVINPKMENLIKNEKIVEKILEERKINNYPPYKRIVLLKEGSQDINKLQEKLLEIKERIKNKDKNIEIFGPITSFPYKIKKRYFLELILKIPKDLDFNLKKVLEDVFVETIDIDFQN